MVSRHRLLATRLANRCHWMQAGCRPRFVSSTGQRGMFAVMCAALIPLMLAFCGLALGLSQIYNRKIELQGMARAVALAAAAELNGTPQGIINAVDKASSTASKFKYDYQTSFTVPSAAISFSDSPLASADWKTSGGAQAAPANIYYVTVDTSQMAASVGTVIPYFLQFVDKSLTTVQLTERAVAGRMGIKVTPLAVCAMGSQAGVARGTELVEYGFRRGVSYDLMKLNPGGTSAENFVVDPLVAPGATAAAYHTSAVEVGPFVCTGTMWMPRITGANIQVTRNFPIGSLYKQLNSRFDDYTGNFCNPNGAPPDINIKSFAYNTGSWMNPVQTQQNASMTPTQVTVGGKMQTVADPLTLPAGTTNKVWGPLWAYAKPAKFSSYVPGQAEPPAGYSTFATTDISAVPLYQTGLSVSGYPTALQGGTPYKSSVTFPTHKALAEEGRRVLYIPLLSCPAATGTNINATVIAVGKFFMTVPATASSVSAEFAGIAPAQSYAGGVELSP